MSGSGFEYTGLYVRVLCELPENWSLVDGCVCFIHWRVAVILALYRPSLESVSQICTCPAHDGILQSMASIGCDDGCLGASHFGFPFEYGLLWENDAADPDVFPSILFEVTRMQMLFQQVTVCRLTPWTRGSGIASRCV